MLTDGRFIGDDNTNFHHIVSQDPRKCRRAGDAGEANDRLHRHTAIEGRLAELGLPATVLQPSTFTDLLARAAPSVATNSWGGAAGSGRVNLIDTRDIADVAYAVLRDGPNKHATQTYRLTGPEAVSMHDVARRLSALLGTEVSYLERTPEQQAAQLTADGLPPLVVEILLGVDESFRDRAHGSGHDGGIGATATVPASRRVFSVAVSIAASGW